MNASWALQQAVFAALGADADVKAALGDPPRIFDAVPRDAAFPFAVIGDDAQSDWTQRPKAAANTVLPFASGRAARAQWPKTSPKRLRMCWMMRR